MSQISRRRSGFEVKFVSPNPDEMTFEGYGAFFGNIDSYGDVIAPGAFAACIERIKSGQQEWPAMLLQHGGWGISRDDLTPIGVWTSIDEDAKGLRVTGTLASTDKGHEVYNLLKMQPRPALNGMSIGYLVIDYEMHSGAKQGEAICTLKTIDLREISIVTFPANQLAQIDSVKSSGIKTIREFEEFLRDAGGFSHAAARDIARGGFKARTDSRDENGGLDELVAALRRTTAILQPTT